jgi:hypothetical protein
MVVAPVEDRSNEATNRLVFLVVPPSFPTGDFFASKDVTV